MTTLIVDPGKSMIEMWRSKHTFPGSKVLYIDTFVCSLVTLLSSSSMKDEIKINP